MPSDPYSNLYVLLTKVPDPRDPRGKRHPLADVLFIMLVAVLAGAEDADSIEDFAEYNEDWFRERCGLQHGVPSQDTYLRVLAAMSPKAFGEAFTAWVQELWGGVEGQHVAIDGKTLRRSFDRARDKSAVHSVSAFASGLGLVLGQVSVDDKENEILAIPKLLKLIDVRGATVTIDAMGCQRDIAQAIVEAGGDYVLQVKDNQPTLRRQLDQFFMHARATERKLDDPAPELSFSSSVDKGHGRIEERSCWLSHDLSWIDKAAEWSKLSAVAMVERKRQNAATGHESTEVAYFLVSDPHVEARRLGEIIRDHWSIENSMHWVLDMTFDEDLSRIRVKNAAENMATIRRAALNLLRAAPPPPAKRKRAAPLPLKRKRWICDIDIAYRETVLRFKPQEELP
jgi:predicted transposase YbfD/YdcC